MSLAKEFIEDIRDKVYFLQIAIDALKRISSHEVRADRRRTGMVDVSEIYDLQRIADVALDILGEDHEQSKRIN